MWNFFKIDYSFLSACTYIWHSGETLPAKHLRVVVDGDVGSGAVVVGPKVAVWCPEPFIESMLQRQVLESVAQMPARCEKQTSNHHRANI